MESSKSESQDIRVKLCGREFIRMVVTSCGSSRLKRNAPDSGPLYTKPHSRFAFFRHSFELYAYVFFVSCLHPLIFTVNSFIRKSSKPAQRGSPCIPEMDPNQWRGAVEGVWVHWKRDRASRLPHESTSRGSGTLHNCAGCQHVVQSPARCRAGGRVLHLGMHYEWTDSVLLSSYLLLGQM